MVKRLLYGLHNEDHEKRKALCWGSVRDPSRPSEPSIVEMKSKPLMGKTDSSIVHYAL